MFMWCHVRNLNLVERNPQRITKEDSLVHLIMKKLIFLPQKKVIVILKSKIISVLMCFVMRIN